MRRERRFDYHLRTRGRLATLRKHSFEEVNKGRYKIHAKDIWLDPIPEDPDQAVMWGVAACVSYIFVQDETVDHNRGWKAPPNIYTPFIPPSFGKRYTVDITDADGKRIPDGHEVGMTFYYESGYLLFEKDPTEFFKPPFSVFGYGYVGRTLADYTGVPQLYPLSAVVFEKEDGYELQVAFIDTTDTVSFVDVYGIDENGQYVLIASMPLE